MNPDAMHSWRQAQACVASGDHDRARSMLESILVSNPEQIAPRMLLSGVLLAQGKVRAATEQLLAIAPLLSPEDAWNAYTVAQGLSRLGEVNATRACLRHPALLATRSGPLLAAVAHLYQGLGLDAEALQLMDRARGCGFDNPDFRYYRALQLQFNGRLAEAEAEMESCLRLGPTFGRASLSLARIRRQNAESNHVDFIRDRLARVEPGSEDHAAFEFALHKELDDLGEYDDAWAALERGNAVMAARLPYDNAGEERLFDAIARRFDAAFAAGPAIRQQGAMPVFVVGMPRSGTTLLERILGNHSQVASAGELNDLPRQLRWTADRHGFRLLDEALLDAMPGLDFPLLGRRYLGQSQWRARGRRYYVDKLPPNFMLVGCIRRALPQAKVVHISRDPMDICFSNYRALFGDAYAYSYDIGRLAHHHRLYRRLMRHWQETLPGFVLELPYSDLVLDTEASCRRLLGFCDLPFEPGCLDHTRNSASVATLSSAQVRQPIHARSLGEWRRYARQLQPLADLLEQD
jgi:tetratricopeptide (TPR) repeat protein